jgi:hypothetical protein
MEKDSDMPGSDLLEFLCGGLVSNIVKNIHRGLYVELTTDKT